MAFFGEISSFLGLDALKLIKGFHYVNYNNQALYIEGIKKIKEFGLNRLVFAVDKGEMIIEGEELTIFNYEYNSVIIKGKIRCVNADTAEE